MLAKLMRRESLLFVLAVVGLVGVYIWWRTARLNALPVFVDEAIYVRWSQVMRAEPTLRFLPLSDGKQPLFMWLTIPFFKIFSDPLVAGRLVSVSAGLGTLIGIIILAHILTNRWRLSLLAGLFYVFMPFAHFFDRMALADSLLSMFGIWSIILGLLLVHLKRLDLAMILGFVLGGAVLTKSPGWLFLFLQPLLVFSDTRLITLSIRKMTRGTWMELLKILGLWVVAALIAFGMYNILRLGPNFHMIAIRNQDYIFSLSELRQHPLNPLIGNLKDTFSWLVNLLTPAGVILVIASLLRRPQWVLSLWLWVLLPLIFQAEVARAYTSRYFYYVVPLLALLAAWGLFELHKRWRIIAIALTAAFLALSGRYIWQLNFAPQAALLPQNMAHGYLQEWTAGWGQKEVARYLLNRPQTSIVVGTDGFFGTLPDGLQIYTQGASHIVIIGVGVVLDKVPTQLTEALVENEVYLVINQSRNHIPQTELDTRFELIARYPKPARPNGTQEALEFYRLLR